MRAPEFLVKKIGQNTGVPGANNTLCITLRSNMDLNPESVVVLSSLGYVDGTISASNGEINLHSIVPSEEHHLSFGAYKDATPGKGLWDDDGKILNLVVQKKMLAGCDYGFCFVLANPLCGQGAQPGPRVGGRVPAARARKGERRGRDRDRRGERAGVCVRPARRAREPVS